MGKTNHHSSKDNPILDFLEHVMGLEWAVSEEINNRTPVLVFGKYFDI